MAELQQSKGLHWMKKIALELIVLIFVIGFFSQSLLNYTLPRVTSVPVISGQVVKTYQMMGSVEYRDLLHVRLGNPVIIDEFYLEPGRRVSEGDPLFRINPGYPVKMLTQQIAEITSELERERMALDKLAIGQEKDSKGIQLLEMEVRQAEEELETTKILYESGAVSRKHLTDQDREVDRLRIQWEIAQLEAEKQAHNFQIEEKEKRLTIDALENELEQLNRGKTFYAQVDDEGIYHAAMDGLMTYAALTGQILGQDDIAVTIARVNEEMEGLVYRGTLSETDGKQFDFGDLLDVKLEGVAEAIRIKITNLFYDANEDLFRVEGQIMRDIPRQVTIRKQYRGEMVRREQAAMVVPRSALRGGDLRPGEKGSIFLLEKEAGILGDHHTVRETEVTIMNVGDHYISVMGIEGVERPRVVTPITHRVRDGVKVLHGY